MDFALLLSSALRYSVVFIFGSCGVCINEKSGHLNMGIPGIVCLGSLGALIGAWAVTTGVPLDEINVWIVLLISSLLGITFAALGGLIFAFFAVTLKCNQNVTGLVITTFSSALVAYFISTLPADSVASIARAGALAQHLFPGYDALNNTAFEWFGKIFCSQSIFAYSSIIIAIVVSIILNKTRIGLNLRACGENPASADAAGINVGLYRYLATIIGAAIAGLGGVAYQLDYSAGLYNAQNDIAAFGWLALALVILSAWKPWLCIITSFGLGILSFLPYYLTTATVMTEFIKIIPYIATILVLILTSVFNSKKMSAPQGLGQSYFREDR